MEESDKKGIYYFRIPKSDPAALRRFLNDNIPADEDSKKLFASYLAELRDRLELKLTFDQELAFKDKSLTFINIYHPIIQAGVIMYEKTADKSRRTFFFEMDASQMPEEIKAGCYLLAIFKICVNRLVFDKNVETDSLYPILYDLHEDKIVEDYELAEKFMGKAQIYGRYAPFTEDLRIEPEVIDCIEYDLKEEVDKYVEGYHADQLMRIENNKKMRYQQTEQYYETRIANAKRNIKNQEEIIETAVLLNDVEMRSKAERILPPMRGALQNLIQQRDDELEKINRDVQLKVTDEVKSLNLVKIV